MDILVTGATGNVGAGVLAGLAGSGHDIWAGLRDPAKASLPDGIKACRLDFATGEAPDRQFDAIFLMRPPELADPAMFRRFLAPLARRTRIVFLSVQGAESRRWLPHAKIEKVIAEMGFEAVFVRPGYFMDNLLTTLAPDLARDGTIYLPAGQLALDWVSVRDVAAIAVAALTGAITEPAITVGSGRLTGFAEVCTTVNAAAGTAFRYRPVSLPGFVVRSRRIGRDWPFILIMLMLHFLPRFTAPAPPAISDLPRLLGREAETLAEFAARNRTAFRRLSGIG